MKENLEDIKILDISGRWDIKELPSGLVNLVELNCSKTGIKNIPDTFVNLEKITADFSFIESIPETLTGLKYLSIECTNVCKLPHLPNLIVLNCSKTAIREIPDSCRELIELNCGETFVQNIPPNFTGLKNLYINKTDIKKLPQSLEKIEILNCSDTRVKIIPTTYENLKVLTTYQHYTFDFNDIVETFHNLEEITYCNYGISYNSVMYTGPIYNLPTPTKKIKINRKIVKFLDKNSIPRTRYLLFCYLYNKDKKFYILRHVIGDLKNNIKCF